MATSSDRPNSHELEEDLSVLERRLRDGEELVRHGRETNGDPELLDRWEAGWIKLLRQYEILCDRVQRHASPDRRQVSQ